MSRETTAPQTSLLVLSKSNRALFIVSPANLEMVGQVPSVPDPQEEIASSDGRTAIHFELRRAYNSITVIDLVNRKELPTIDLGPLRGRYGLAFARKLACSP